MYGCPGKSFGYVRCSDSYEAERSAEGSHGSGQDAAAQYGSEPDLSCVGSGECGVFVSEKYYVQTFAETNTSNSAAVIIMICGHVVWEKLPADQL